MGVRGKKGRILRVETGVEDSFDSGNVYLGILDAGMVTMDQDSHGGEEEEIKQWANSVWSFRHGIYGIVIEGLGQTGRKPQHCQAGMTLLTFPTTFFLLCADRRSFPLNLPWPDVASDLHH
jgi:hypothetical protein